MKEHKNNRIRRNENNRKSIQKENSRSSKNSKNILNSKKVNRKDIEQQEKFRKKKRRKRCLLFFLIILIILLIMYVISLYKWNKLIKDFMNCENSIVVDSTGNIVAVLGESKIHERVSLQQIPDDLENAYIAIEDKTFKDHHGINVKRTMGATLSFIKNKGSASYGGSTITQQLIKNITGENETKITRKVKEWDRAIKTEFLLSKDEILELYLNIIYVGPNIYGVQKGAEYYFDKDVSELELAECAFLAGINHSPNTYNPFRDLDNEEKIERRTKIVLSEMLNQGYINHDVYNEAIEDVEEGLNFKEGKPEAKGNAVYSYFVDATISEVILDLAEKKKISTSFAENYLYWGGLKIYSTQNSDIQTAIEDECKKTKYIKKSEQNKDNTTQAAMVVIDNETGFVVGCVGGLGEKETSRGFNRAVQAVRQTGSAIKPIAVLGPALEENILNSVTIYNDAKTTFENDYSPDNYSGQLGNITVRRAVESSQNIPFVKMMEQLTSKKAIKYMEKQGITTLTEKDNSLPLALGGLEKGISPLQMAGAYASIANDGEYVEPIFYVKIENKKGKAILKNKQNKEKVYSEDTAFILKKLLEQPIVGQNGTAKNCSINGVEVSAKTGTTDNFYDKWLCGFTPYYTAVTWYGFDQNEKINENSSSSANLMWSSVMNEIHKNLQSKQYDKVKGVEEVRICCESGMVASGNCTNTYIEFFRKNNVMKIECNVQHTGTKKMYNIIDSSNKQNDVNKVDDSLDNKKDNNSVKNDVEDSGNKSNSYVDNKVNSIYDEKDEDIHSEVDSDYDYDVDYEEDIDDDYYDNDYDYQEDEDDYEEDEYETEDDYDDNEDDYQHEEDAKYDEEYEDE